MLLNFFIDNHRLPEMVQKRFLPIPQKMVLTVERILSDLKQLEKNKIGSQTIFR